jgi:hypothetical protein
VGGADGMWTSISPHYYATHARSPARFRPRRADWPSPLAIAAGIVAILSLLIAVVSFLTMLNFVND